MGRLVRLSSLKFAYGGGRGQIPNALDAIAGGKPPFRHLVAGSPQPLRQGLGARPADGGTRGFWEARRAFCRSAMNSGFGGGIRLNYQDMFEVIKGQLETVAEKLTHLRRFL
jgi:hypothetical protein